MNSLVFAGGTIKSAFFNASIVRAMRHIERTATITDPAEAAAQASDEQRSHFSSAAEALYKRSERNRLLQLITQSF
jgi:hypothetical protein